MIELWDNKSRLSRRSVRYAPRAIQQDSPSMHLIVRALHFVSAAAQLNLPVTAPQPERFVRAGFQMLLHHSQGKNIFEV